MRQLIVSAEPSGRYTVWLTVDGEVTEYVTTFDNSKAAFSFCHEARVDS